VEKLRMMRVPLAGLEESPMIGKVVRRFYRKVAPPHSRAWNSAGKLYQDLRRQVLGNTVIVREMEEQGDMSVVPEVTAGFPYEEDSWVEPTSVTTLLAREESLHFGERLVAGTGITISISEAPVSREFNESIIPVTNATIHSVSISSEAPMESTALSFSEVEPEQGKRKAAEGKRKAAEK
jgi:hypothetical protein